MSDQRPSSARRAPGPAETGALFGRSGAGSRRSRARPPAPRPHLNSWRSAPSPGSRAAHPRTRSFGRGDRKLGGPPGEESRSRRYLLRARHGRRYREARLWRCRAPRLLLPCYPRAPERSRSRPPSGVQQRPPHKERRPANIFGSTISNAAHGYLLQCAVRALRHWACSAVHAILMRRPPNPPRAGSDSAAFDASLPFRLRILNGFSCRGFRMTTPLRADSRAIGAIVRKLL